jgi:hypothetical protein
VLLQITESELRHIKEVLLSYDDEDDVCSEEFGFAMEIINSLLQYAEDVHNGIRTHYSLCDTGCTG